MSRLNANSWPAEKLQILVDEAAKRTTFSQISDMLNAKYPDKFLSRSACIAMYTRLRLKGLAPAIKRSVQKRRRPPPPEFALVPSLPKIKTKIEPDLVEEIIPISRPVVNGREPCHLLDLDPDSCRWVLANQLFCNLVKEPGHSYCATHREAARRKAGFIFDRDDDLLIMRLWTDGAKAEEIASQIGCAAGDIVYRATQKLRLRERRHG